MKILVADRLPQSMMDSLSKKGHECTINSSLTTEELPDFIKDHEVLVVRSTIVNADVLDSGDNLKLVVRAGSGTNTIDKEHASNKGIKVCNVPGANSIAVAELAMGLIISVDRNIPDNVFDLRKGIWNKKKYSSSKGIYGRNLGILGLGAVGLALAERSSAFGMNIFGVAKSSRSKESESRILKIGIDLLDTREELLKKCDVVSIHLPSVAETKNLVNQNFLNQMKEGALLVNTSRGELVDEVSLIKAMDERGIRAALDVYANEPDAGDSDFNAEIARHPNFYGTHHIGASTQQAQNAVAEGVIEVIEEFANGRLINCLN